MRADDGMPPISNLPVTVVHPAKGGLDKTTTQPGTIQAYESVQLFAKVPGFLKSQTVDIGARVKRGEILAVVDVPELEKEVKREKAAVAQERSRVLQMKARVQSAQADLEAVVSTEVGAFRFEFAADKAPRHVEQFLKLARQGYYDGGAFYRPYRRCPSSIERKRHSEGCKADPQRKQ